MSKILGGKLEAVILSALGVPLILFGGIAFKALTTVGPSVLEVRVTRNSFDSVDQTFITLKNHYPVALSPVVVESNIDTSVYIGIQGAASDFRIEGDGNILFDIAKHEEVTILLVSPAPLSLPLESIVVHGSYNLVNDRGFSVRKEVMVLSDETFDKEVQKKLYQWGIPTILVLTLIIFVTLRQSRKQDTQIPEETTFIPAEEELPPTTDAEPPFEIPTEEELPPTKDDAPPSEIPAEEELPPTTDTKAPYEIPTEEELPPTTDTKAPSEIPAEEELPPTKDDAPPSEAGDISQFKGHINIKTRRRDYKIVFQDRALIPPITLRDVPVGEHIIIVKRPGMHETVTIDVKENDTVTIDLDESFPYFIDLEGSFP